MRAEWLPPLDAGSVGFGAMCYARIEVPEKEKDLAVVRGMEVLREENGLIIARRHNAFVNLGLHYVLDRIFNLNTPATSVSHMGISDDNTAVTASTLLLDPTAGGGSPNIKALGTGTGATATSRTAETVTCSAGWTKTDGNIVIRKVGLLNVSTDAGDDTVPTVQGVLNIIGGAGSGIYNEQFTVDLTALSAFNLTFSMDVTAQAT